MNLQKAIKEAKRRLLVNEETHLVVWLGGDNYEVIVAGAYDGEHEIHHIATSPQDTISISPGNRKTGAIPSVSLHPDITCSGKGRKCHTRGLKGVPGKSQAPRCYALRNMADLRKNIDSAWKRNCDILGRSRSLFFWQIEAYLRKKTPQQFRWFVGGGCPDQKFLDRTKVLAYKIPSVDFLMFDKGYDIGLDYDFAPDNMAIVLSTWPGMPLPGKEYDSFSRAWLNVDPRAPEGAKPCSNKCTSCGLCWELGNNRGDVVMHVH